MEYDVIIIGAGPGGIFSAFELMKKSPETTYTLIHKHQISSATIDRLRKNRPLSTSTINDLCIILGCSPENILAFTPPSPETKENDIFLKHRSLPRTRE